MVFATLPNRRISVNCKSEIINQKSEIRNEYVPFWSALAKPVDCLLTFPAAAAYERN
jgi:hypothetical protein